MHGSVGRRTAMAPLESVSESKIRRCIYCRRERDFFATQLLEAVPTEQPPPEASLAVTLYCSREIQNRDFGGFFQTAGASRLPLRWNRSAVGNGDKLSPH